MKTQAAVCVNGPFHVLALVQLQIVLLVLLARGSVLEGRNPSSLRLQGFGSLLCNRADKSATSTLYNQIRVKDRVLWLFQTCTAQLTDATLHVTAARLQVLLQRPHEELCWQPTLALLILRTFPESESAATCLCGGHVSLIEHELFCRLLRHLSALRNHEEQAWLLAFS